jgi:hypothetical protein
LTLLANGQLRWQSAGRGQYFTSEHVFRQSNAKEMILSGIAAGCRCLHLGIGIVLGASLIQQLAFASSSGLNNIPTADTAPNLTLVIQGYSLFGSQRSPDHFAAFKFGVDPWESRQWRNRFEWGLDSRIGSGEIGPSVLQAKWATQPGPKWPAISVGVANLAPTRSERSRAGEPFSFIVLSQDLKVFRLHGGYALQTGNNNTVMLGLDRTFNVFRRAFTLRTDALQTDHSQNWAVSFGGLYAISKFFAAESWITQPTHGRPPSFTLKIDFSILFSR